MSIDHDQIFKQLIEAFFREFTELFFPAEARLINFAKVEFVRDELFTDVKRGRHKRLDLVVKVGLKKGGEKFILVHVEFEASRKQSDFPKRMFQYFCQLFLRHDTEIIPVAVFTDDAVWRKPVSNRYQLQLRSRKIVDFEYELIKLKNLNYRRYLKSSNPLAYALVAKMGYNRKERARLKADFLRLILGAKIDPARRSLLVDFIETYMTLTQEETKEFNSVVASERKYKRVEEMITTYEQEGIKKGRTKGKQEDLILLLEKRFGKLKPATKRKIGQIDSSKELESLLLSAVDAKSLDDLDW